MSTNTCLWELLVEYSILSTSALNLDQQACQLVCTKSTLVLGKGKHCWAEWPVLTITLRHVFTFLMQGSLKFCPGTTVLGPFYNMRQDLQYRMSTFLSLLLCSYLFQGVLFQCTRLQNQHCLWYVTKLPCLFEWNKKGKDHAIVNLL